MKKIFLFVLCFLSFTSFAAASECGKNGNPPIPCPIASTGPTFCPEFVSAAHCQCKNNMPTPPFPPGYCDTLSMVTLYSAMIAASPKKTLDSACHFQHSVDYATCMQHWTLYGQRCEALPPA